MIMVDNPEGNSPLGPACMKWQDVEMRYVKSLNGGSDWQEEQLKLCEGMVLVANKPQEEVKKEEGNTSSS